MRPHSIAAVAWLVAGSVLSSASLAGCRDVSPRTEPSRFDFPAYTISGTVTSLSGQAIAGVAIEAAGSGIDGQSRRVTVETGASGDYSIGGLHGYVTVRATQPDFYPVSSSVLLDADKSLHLVMEPAAPLAVEGDELIVDRTIHGTIGPSDPRCDPSWDSRAPCRQFGFRAETTKTYRFTLRFPACSELELHVFDPSGQRIGYGDASGQMTVDAVLAGGRDYGIRLMAYYTCDWFELTVK